MDWFYEENGEQNGPISEAELKELVESGKLGQTNLVWSQGMADWAPYAKVFGGEGKPVAATNTCPTCGAAVAPADLIPAGDSQVCPNCREDYAQGIREGLNKPVVGGKGRGTGGMTSNGDIRMMARETLAGNWAIAVVVTFLYFLLQQIGAVVPLIGTIIQWIIAGPLALGYYAYFLGLYRGEPVDVGTLFAGFSDFLKGLGLYFITTIIITTVMLLAAVPGIILIVLAFTGDYPVPEESPLFIGGIFVAAIPAVVASTYMYLRYAFVYLIAKDEPEIGIMECIKRSTQIVNGHKTKLFLLWLSFIGWHILGVMALGIGLLWSMTYMFTATAAFYEDLGEA